MKRSLSLLWLTLLILIAPFATKVAAAREVPFYIVIGQSNTGWTPVSGMTTGDASAYSGLVPNTEIWNPYLGNYSAVLHPMQAGVNTMAENAPDPTHFGPETSLLFKLQDQSSKARIVYKQGEGGTTLATDWKPGVVGATGTGTRWNQFSVWLGTCADQANARGDKLKLEGIVWMQGEDDALTQANADAYLTNLNAFFPAIYARWDELVTAYSFPSYSTRKAIGRIHAPTAYPYRDTVRAAQASYCGTPANNAVMIDTDAYPLQDWVHYNATGQVQFGIDIFNAAGFESGSPSPSSDANLAALTTTAGTLSPGFAAGTTSYTASVANSVTSVTVTPTRNEAHATIAVNGTAVASGSASGAIGLSVGNNAINTVVTAQDGTTTKTYTITVNRASSLSNDASLAALSLSSGTLSPGFASGTTSYTTSVANNVSSLTVTPTRNEAHATITVNGTTVASSSASGAISLSVGNNTITTVVTAQDGTTTRTYTVVVTRASSSGGTTLPSAWSLVKFRFKDSTGADADYIPSGCGSSSAAPCTLPTATMNGAAAYIYTPGGSSGVSATLLGNTGPFTIDDNGSQLAINPNLWGGGGSSNGTISITAGGATQTWYFAAPGAASSDANLSALSLSSGTLSPGFASGTTGYTASVANGVSSLNVTPTRNESHATITVNGAAVTSGTASGSISLSVGTNTITTVVTAQDGTTTKTYTVTVTRAAASSGSLPSAWSLVKFKFKDSSGNDADYVPSGCGSSSADPCTLPTASMNGSSAYILTPGGSSGVSAVLLGNSGPFTIDDYTTQLGINTNLWGGGGSSNGTISITAGGVTQVWYFKAP